MRDGSISTRPASEPATPPAPDRPAQICMAAVHCDHRIAPTWRPSVKASAAVRPTAPCSRRNTAKTKSSCRDWPAAPSFAPPRPQCGHCAPAVPQFHPVRWNPSRLGQQRIEVQRERRGASFHARAVAPDGVDFAIVGQRPKRAGPHRPRAGKLRPPPNNFFASNVRPLCASSQLRGSRWLRLPHHSICHPRPLRRCVPAAPKPLTHEPERVRCPTPQWRDTQRGIKKRGGNP